ncbi:large ribosomal subunit protein mL52 [Bombyx mori]|uniref:Large ribosomal subunit protein mL52 n=1 Tax=Bombyx mori TaxID=7091 RepID=A0A8R2AU05_BOMMO|nr:39S ribosomal protein L52, mitochondrial isoform X1 [Bombyx mori]
MNNLTGNKILKTITGLRSFSSCSALFTKNWRVARGLPVNRNAEGILTDGPDYTFLDGRPTPLLHKQKLRMQRQRQLAEQIVTLSSELQFAKDRYQKIQKEEQEKRQEILNNRLKPKGMMLQKKNLS